MKDRWLTGEEVARVLNVSGARVRQMAIAGQLKRAQRKIGLACLYDRQEIELVAKERMRLWQERQDRLAERKRPGDHGDGVHAPNEEVLSKFMKGDIEEEGIKANQETEESAELSTV